ncbi:MAG: phage portal protein, partial [Beijerinckiaceae bacterium]
AAEHLTPAAPVEQKPCEPSKVSCQDYDYDDSAFQMAQYLVQAGSLNFAASLVQWNPILSRAVSLVRGAVSGLSFTPDESEAGRVEKKDQQFWMDALRTPWAGASLSEFLALASWPMMVRGEVYIRVNVTPSAGMLSVCRPQDWTVYRKANTHEPAYLENNLTRKRLDFLRWPNIPTTGEFVVRASVADYEPGVPHAPIRGALEAREVFGLIYRQCRMILENKPALSGIISAKGAEQWTPDNVKDITAALERYRLGGHKAGGFLVVSTEANVTSFSQNVEKVLTPEARKDAASDIAIALGIPTELIGLGNTTYNNMGFARGMFYENTVLPLYGDTIIDALSSAVLAPYAPLIVDRDAIDALQISRLEAMAQANGITFLSEDEKREMFGYGPMKAQDKKQQQEKQQQDKPRDPKVVPLR